MSAVFRLLATLLRKVPASVLLVVAEQLLARLGKIRAADPGYRAPQASSVEPPHQPHQTRNDRRE